MSATHEEPVRSNSHSVKFDYDGEVSKEEVFLSYATTWRGQEAIVQMSCDRYRFADGRLSDWRVYATEARGKQDEAGRYGPHLTELARQRLGDQFRDAATAWLMSDAYATSYRGAIDHAIVYAANVRTWTNATDGPRRLVARYRDVLGQTRSADLLRALDAFDSFAALLNGAES